MKNRQWNKQEYERREHQHNKLVLLSVWSLDTGSQVADRVAGSAESHSMLGGVGHTAVS